VSLAVSPSPFRRRDGRRNCRLQRQDIALSCLVRFSIPNASGIACFDVLPRLMAIWLPFALCPLDIKGRGECEERRGL
jgi:hypothetical protein